MRTYEQIKAWARAVLDDAGMSDVENYPGPDLPDVSIRHIVWTRYGGPGYEGGEHATDFIAWQPRCIGLSLDHNSSEEIADLIDVALTGLPSGKVNGVHVVQVTRVGGAPNPLLVDDADRTHFVCNYNIEQSSALPTG